MTVFEYLASDFTTLIWVVGIFGLVIGSFLNVVIYRYPIILERGWKAECAAYLGQEIPPEPVFNLMHPRSRCPHCGHEISALENIPIISYLWQRGRCRACQQAISIRYPLVEASSAILAMLITAHFGYGLPLLAALILTWSLLAMSMIDIDHQILPDDMTLPLLWLGILCNYFELFTNLHASILGAILGYLSLWSVYWGFKLLTGKEGMGYGDFKLLAALGAWMGWQFLPVIILLSSVVGAILGVSLLFSQGRDKNTPIPFGPYLACAGWISLLWGNQLLQAYLHLSL